MCPRGVIHQLCRVLVLLHKKDPVVSIPSDAPGLLQWTQQMLDDHREQQVSHIHIVYMCFIFIAASCDLHILRKQDTSFS